MFPINPRRVPRPRTPAAEERLHGLVESMTTRYDRMYLHRLRARMRAALKAAERYSADWHELSRQYNHIEDPVKRFVAKRDSRQLQDTLDDVKFHRDWAGMYAAVLQAEIAAAPHMGQSPTEDLG